MPRAFGLNIKDEQEVPVSGLSLLKLIHSQFINNISRGTNQSHWSTFGHSHSVLQGQMQKMPRRDSYSRQFKHESVDQPSRGAIDEN